jgi:CubicO group peptidase (beta-lactamase class C family)
VFEPLAMHATGADSERLPDRATSYFPRYAADPRYGPDPMREVDYTCYAGSSVFVSTAPDLVRFGLAMAGGTLLQPATVQLLQTPQRLPSGKDTGYGLGWDLETVDLAGTPAATAGHDGWLLGGPASALLTFPDRGLVVAVISNTSYADPEAIAVQVAQAFATPPERPGPAR